MSWAIFKSNILRKTNPSSVENSIDDVAKIWAKEYDAAVKRGTDSVNFINLQTGNVPGMESLFRLALIQGQNTPTSTFSLVTQFGNGVLTYWTGATMNVFPIPLIPAPGSIQNIVVNSNVVVNPGVWSPQPPLSPNDNRELIIDQFINAATQHLTTVSGIILTTSLYPSAPSPIPAPGVISWTGYTIPPAKPAVASVISTDIANLTQAYSQLDFSNIPLDINDVDVQDIINPNINKINQQIAAEGARDDLGKSAATQLNTIKVEILDSALRDQGLSEVPELDDELTSGYKNLDELLKIAGRLAPKLGKNARVNYNNLRSGYIKGVHGLCPQGTQAVVVALTGITGLGTIRGHADWFSFKTPTTAPSGVSSFSKEIGGKRYYNDKVRVDRTFITNRSLWQVGDIIVMGYVGGKKYGHIQVWTGWKWVSDFTQNAVQQRKVDFNTIALWRLNGNGKAAVEAQKKNYT
jgi:hypothetical protein